MGRKDKDEKDEPVVTVGRRPDVFHIDDSQNLYMIGAEVGTHFKLTRGLLYRRYFCLTCQISYVNCNARWLMYYADKSAKRLQHGSIYLLKAY